MNSDVEMIARVCHEANSAYCFAVGDPVLPPWVNLDESYRDSTRAGVRMALNGATPEKLHNSWMAERTSQGWVYGPVLDRVAKVHTNLVPYEQLPPSQRVKDALFTSIVEALRA